MNTQLKQKVIGIITIVVFLAIAIPFLLSGTKSKNNDAASVQQLAIQTSPGTAPTTATAPSTVTPVADNPLPLPDNNLTSQTTAPQVASQADAGTSIQPPPANRNLNNPAPTLTSTPAPIIDQALPKTQAIKPDDSNVNTPAPSASTSDVTETPAETLAGRENLAVTTTPPAAALNTQNPALAESLKQKEGAAITKIIHKGSVAKSVKVTQTAKAATSDAKVRHKANKLTAKPAKATNNSANKIANKKYVINLGGYANKQKALSLVAKLKKDGYKAYTRNSKKKHKPLTLVLVGPVANQEQANKLAHRIEKNFGIKVKACHNNY